MRQIAGEQVHTGRVSIISFPPGSSRDGESPIRQTDDVIDASEGEGQVRLLNKISLARDRDDSLPSRIECKHVAGGRYIHHGHLLELPDSGARLAECPKKVSVGAEAEDLRRSDVSHCHTICTARDISGHPQETVATYDALLLEAPASSDLP